MILHWCVMTGTVPGEPEQYTATCGYTSENKKEFRFDSMERVTCSKCMRHVGSMRTQEREDELRPADL